MSGPEHGEYWSACYQASGCIYWGTAEIDGPDGTWTGPWSGMDDAVLGLASFHVDFEGTGAYEGWSFLAHWQDSGSGEAEFSGLIYEGHRPPWEPAE